MYIATLTLLVSLIIFLAIIILFIYVLYLLIKALKKYIKSEPARKERAERKKTLGEVIKKHRVDCKMTQEFVAETIGVSRQAVSKWETGVSQSLRNYPKLTLTLLPIQNQRFIGGIIMAQNLTYTQYDDYYISDIRLAYAGTKSLGKYSRMRRTFLKEY